MEGTKAAVLASRAYFELRAITEEVRRDDDSNGVEKARERVANDESIMAAIQVIRIWCPYVG